MREKIEYTLVKMFLYIAKIMPVFAIYTLFKWITLLVYHLDKKRRALTIKNLQMAYPDKTSREIKELSKKVYSELSKTISEILLMFVDRFDIDDAVTNKEEVIMKLKKLSLDVPHGVIAMTAHFSNWELLAHFLAKHGLPMLVIGREGNNKLIEEHITQPFRKKYGNDTANKKKAILAMVKKLRNGGNVGILIDQRSGIRNGVMVDFFGKPAETTTSIASLKLKFDPKIVPCFAVRTECGKYKIVIQDPVEYQAAEEDDETKKIEKMTAGYNDIMESIIREYPAQWFWMHNRWRISV